MLVSRASGLLRKSAQVVLPRRNPIKNQSRRSHDHAHDDPAQGWVYRNRPHRQPAYELAADCMGGFMWWWILYHIYHDGHHLLGHPDYPEPSKWTDEELGIPPDDQVYENYNPDTCVYPPGFYNKK